MHNPTTDSSRVSIRPGPSVLSVLRHLNYKPWYALAEFVDNSIQSVAERAVELRDAEGKSWRLKVSIEIDTSSPGRIIIRDNAAGISSQNFARAFRPAVVPLVRTGLSEFGMGMKSAACWFAPHWQVRTKAVGENVERTIRFDIARIVRDELEELTIEERFVDPQRHYTEVILENLYNIPQGRTIGKIKDHLADIYRVFLRDKLVDIEFRGEPLTVEHPQILEAPYYKDIDGASRLWRKEIDFELGGGLSVKGFAALRDPGNYSRSGFSLFRRGRLIEGGGEEGYRPQSIFGTSGSSSYARLRLFGELHLNGFQVSHTKDGFRWDENEEPFLELLKEHLDSDDMPLLRQCEHYRSLASKKDRVQAATKALDRTSDAIVKLVPDVLSAMSGDLPVETASEPLPYQATLAARVLRFNFQGVRWTVRIELSDDPAESDWLSISDRTSDNGDTDTIQIRVSMAHPLMVAFAQTDPHQIEPLTRIAAALALSELLARRAGVKSAGTVRRNLNKILWEALSKI